MAEEIKRVQYQCGACFHWNPVDMSTPTIGEPKRGVCFGAPPTALGVSDKHGNMVGQRNLRPITPENEHACGAFTPIEMGDGAANDLNG